MDFLDQLPDELRTLLANHEAWRELPPTAAGTGVGPNRFALTDYREWECRNCGLMIRATKLSDGSLKLYYALDNTDGDGWVCFCTECIEWYAKNLEQVQEIFHCGRLAMRKVLGL